MKKALALIALSASLMLTGCPQPNSTPNPALLAPGYLSQADQTMGQTLAAANAFYNRIQQDSAAGKITLSQPEKTAMNALGLSLNIANGTYLSYHNGTATAAQAQSAIDTVSQKQQAAQAAGVI